MKSEREIWKLLREIEHGRKWRKMDPSKKEGMVHALEWVLEE